MFPARVTNQASSISGSVQFNVAPTSNLRTSTAVVKSLATGLLEASRGQAAVSKYLNFKFGMGQKAGYAVSLWLSLRKLASQMEMLEQLASKANRPMNARDFKLAALRSVDYLNRLVKNLKDVEKNHPSFRMELIEHLENMIRWCPQSPQVWAIACKSLRPGEYVNHQNTQFDSGKCRVMVHHLLAAARRQSVAQPYIAMQAGRP